jgi:hypothetical protein
MLRRTEVFQQIDVMGHSRPSHFVPVLNKVRYASDSDRSRYESELTLWAISRHRAVGDSYDFRFRGVM